MYGGIFKQRFGWYIKQEELKLGIDPYQIRELNILPEECTPAFYDYVQRLAHLMNNNVGTEGELYKLQREFQNAPRTGSCGAKNDGIFCFGEKGRA